MINVTAPAILRSLPPNDTLQRRPVPGRNGKAGFSISRMSEVDNINNSSNSNSTSQNHYRLGTADDAVVLDAPLLLSPDRQRARGGCCPFRGGNSATARTPVAVADVATSGTPEEGAGVGGDRQGGGRSSPAAAASAAARTQFDEAMAALPRETKAAYLEAKRVAPRLVEKESNPDAYLEYDHYDPWRAALRVATYWTFRTEIFGGERAYRPMTLAGSGAMSPDDVKVFQTGFLMVLPNDRHGRAVVRRKITVFGAGDFVV